MRRFILHTPRGRFLGRLIIGQAALLIAIVALGETAEIESPNLNLSAEAWHEADALFHRDPRWLGGDDANSIDLGSGRVVWFFGDSFVAPSVAGERKGTTMVRNSVGIQTGYDPTTAKFKCYWREVEGKPSSFIPNEEPDFYWPGGGLILDGKLLVLSMRARDADEELNFRLTGWGAVLIDNLEEEPSNWKVQKLSVPQNKFGVLVGSASLVRDEQFVYAFSVQGRSHDVFLVRWALADASNGDLAHPQWWTGEDAGWIDQSDLAELPTPLFMPGQTEFTVHYSPELASFVQIQFAGYPLSPIAVRTAPSLTGPWSSLESFFWPEESRTDDPGLMLYAAKAHPEQSTEGLALTYNSNAFRLARVIDDQRLYYPRFIKVKIERPGE